MPARCHRVANMSAFSVLRILLLAVLAWSPPLLAEPRPPVEAGLLAAYQAGEPVFTLIDARSGEEYAAGHVRGAVNIPFDRLDEFRSLLPPGKHAPILIYCRSGRRAGMLAEALAREGYTDARVLPSEQLVVGDGTITFKLGQE